MNRLLLLILLIVVSQSIYAQSTSLTVQGSGTDMHLVHTIAPKENWYSIGRIYNISPKDIAPYNHLTIDNPLSIGQQLNIPLTAVNFTKTNNKASDEALIALYQNRTAVGYLKVKKALSPLAAVNGSAVVMPVKEIAAPPVVAKSEPVTAAKSAPVVAAKPEPVKEEVKVVPVKPTPAEERPAANFKGGSFKSQFESSGKSNSGAAGVFKSTSGWQDGKYYALINNVPVGTIVKISNAASGKSVYAKVLGDLADMKENAGLTARVSDAAASELDGEGRFDVEVKY